MTSREQHSKYNRSAKGRARSQRYRATDKGHANERRSHMHFSTARRSTRIEQIEKELT